jgi:UDP-3-O-[3-hydroxymyristoyl] N-acetylglucosamine deacetylase
VMSRRPRRCTIGAPTQICGLGVRTGNRITVQMTPAEPFSGITVGRSDLQLTWPADLHHALDVPNSTCIGDERGMVAFVEHLLAALWAAAISDVHITADGPEMPLLDGSALPWYRAVIAAGRRQLEGGWAPLKPAEPIFMLHEHRAMIALPDDRPRLSYSLLHDHPMIGHQFAQFDTACNSFAEDLAPARTFVTDAELEQLKQASLIVAGSEENCLVIHENQYSSPPFAGNAMARHKLIDMAGDLYLLGRPVRAHVLGYRTGHADNRALARRIAEQKA